MSKEENIHYFLSEVHIPWQWTRRTCLSKTSNKGHLFKNQSGILSLRAYVSSWYTENWQAFLLRSQSNSKPQPLAWSRWQLRILKCVHLPLRVIRSPGDKQFRFPQSTLQGYIALAVLWTSDYALPMDSTNWGHDLHMNVSGQRGNSWESSALGTCKSQSAFLSSLQPTAHHIPEVCCPN